MIDDCHLVVLREVIVYETYLIAIGVSTATIPKEPHYPLQLYSISPAAKLKPSVAFKVGLFKFCYIFSDWLCELQ